VGAPHLALQGGESRRTPQGAGELVDGGGLAQLAQPPIDRLQEFVVQGGKPPRFHTQLLGDPLHRTEIA
jgi:hypothetical protein